MAYLGRLAIAAVFVLAGAGASGAEDAGQLKQATPPDNPKIDVARGDRWTYEIHDDITDELKTIIDFAVTDVTDAEIDTRVRFTNAATGVESTSVQVFDPRWRLKDNGANVYRPALEETGVPADIKVGKTWSYSYEATRVSPPSRFKFVGKAKVEAWERVAVGNGLSYDAFKIDFSSAVTPVMNNRKFESHSEVWYAPEANRYVKRRYESRTNGKIAESTVETLRDHTRRDK